MSIAHISDILTQNFTDISLKEMDSVKLMDRTDTKYVFRFDRLSDILLNLSEHFKVLAVDGVRMNRYETLYYDTQDLDLYHKHQNKKSNRHKIRSRNYVESGINFLEIKLKNNKGRTVKKRIKIDEIHNDIKHCDLQSEFLQITTGYDSINFIPQFWVNYHRITLVNLEKKVRCTIDLNLQFIRQEETIDYSHLAILELKQERSAGSVVSDLMRNLMIREGGLSKYCLGVISMNPEVKQNNFKPKLLYINKLRYAQI